MKWYPSGQIPLMVTHNDTANDQVALSASTHNTSVLTNTTPILFPTIHLSNYCSKTYKTLGAISVPTTKARGLGLTSDARVENEVGHQYILCYAAFTGNVHDHMTPQFWFGRTGSSGSEGADPTPVAELPTQTYHRHTLGSSRDWVQCTTSALILNSSPTSVGDYQPCIWVQFYNHGSTQTISANAFWTFNIYRYHQLTELYDPRG